MAEGGMPQVVREAGCFNDFRVDAYMFCFRGLVSHDVLCQPAAYLRRLQGMRQPRMK